MAVTDLIGALIEWIQKSEQAAHYVFILYAIMKERYLIASCTRGIKSERQNIPLDILKGNGLIGSNITFNTFLHKDMLS